MALLDPAAAREFLEAIIAAFSVLGGLMAYFSGFNAYRSLIRGHAPPVLAHAVNAGLGEGFAAGTPGALIALMIMGWT